MSEIILDSVIDSIKLLPFLFLTYLFMEWLEHKTGAAARKRIRTAGKFGPVWGGLLGVIPQCGFSAAASSLFAGRVITVGTLIAVYLSTSDEMFPIMISNAVPVVTIVKILTCKAVIGILSGLALLAESDCVIMDEPLRGLDEKTRAKTIDYILKKTEGKTLIFVTHEEKEAVWLKADRTVDILTKH